MMDLLPASIAAKMLLTQQNVSLSMMKQNAQVQQQMADILTTTIAGRGQSVNLFA